MTQTINIGFWDEALYGPLSEEAVRALHTPAARHRVSKYTYPSGTKFPGTMRGGRVYVVSGECAYRFQTPVRLARGEYAELPGGDYEFEVLGPESVQLILVWPLPFEVEGERGS